MQHRRRPETRADAVEESASPISAASAAGIFAEGSRFGAYVIGPCIGHGGMARIYRAEHEGLCRQVALKVLTQGVAPGTEGRARFLREARIAAAIKHPNVVNIFDIGVENHIPYLVMELLVGQDLETLLASHGALSEHTIIDIIIPVVAGLVAVHDAGVVHRDLKPGNIFLARGANDDIEPKLLDFGISRNVNSAENMRLTATHGLMMGTPLYMSPEALLGTEMTPLSDQYSLGVVLYECATGVNPFIADSVAETARRVTSAQYMPIGDQPIRPSRRLQAIIERTMSLDPKDRYPDMRALGQELLSLAGQRTRITWALTFGSLAVAARAQHTRDLDEGATALARTRAPKSGAGGDRRWPLATAACAAVAIVTAAFTWSLGRRPSSEQAPPLTVANPALRAPAPVAAARVQQLDPTPPASAPGAGGPSTAAATAGTSGEPAPAPAPGSSELARARHASVSAATAPSASAQDVAAERARARPATPAPTPSARARAAADDVDTPDWLIDRASRTRSTPPRRFPIGTNEAPIFD